MVDNLDVKVTVTGNCGRPHTLDEWQKCKACEGPVMNYKPWWRDTMAGFKEIEPNAPRR